MVLAVRDRVEFYTSPNLKEWSFASEFGSDIPHIHRGIFECPDIFRIRVDEDDNTNKWILMHISDSKSEIIAEFEISTAVKYGFKVRKSSNQETIIGYNISNGELFVDRTKSSAIDFLSDFTAIHKAPMKPEHGRVQLSIYVDWSSVEVFGKQGAGTLRHWRRTKGRIASNQ
ncbi:glycoside hydrolase family 32 protein, partial [Paenibacillus sp. NRS-1775]